MAKKINIEVECPNCGDKFTLTNLDSLAFVHTCTDEICGMKYLVAIDAKRLTAHTELVLTGKKSYMHLQLLLCKDPLVEQEQKAANEEHLIGFYYDCMQWVAFDNSEGGFLRVERFSTEKEAIEWLSRELLDRRDESVDIMWWKIGQTAAWAVMIAYTLFLVFSASQARADNAHDLKAFIDGGTSQQTPTSKAHTAIKKAAYKPLNYPLLRDAVAGGAVEPSYTAIAFYAQTSPDETAHAIKALERDGVIRWNSKKSKWELVK